MRPGFPAWLVFASGLLLAPTASAQAPADPESLRRAADEFEAGRRAHRARDYEGAAVHFENADRAVPNPGALRSAIRARAEAMQMDRAATLAALALARHPENKGLRTYAEGVIASGEKQLHKIEVQCEPECSVALNNRVTPYEEVTRAVLYVEPGEHSIVAGWSGNRTQTSEVQATAGTSSLIELVAPEEEPAVAAGADLPDTDTEAGDGQFIGMTVAPRSGLPQQYFWAGAGLTAVLGGVTIWSGLDTQSNPGPDKVRAECAGQGESCALYQDGLSRQRRTNALLVTTGVVGVATAIVGIFATDWGSGDSEQPTTGGNVVPVVGMGDGVTLGAVGRF